MSDQVIIATIMRPSGATGVQTHFRAFADWLPGRGRTVEIVTPYNAPLVLLLPVFALRRLIAPFSGAASVWWYRHWHALFLRLALRRRLRVGLPCVVYAQCPLSAEAALRTRTSPAQRVVMIVHFNVSQADEWVGKGEISAASALARRIRSFEAHWMPLLDGVVYVSAFMRDVLRGRIPSLAGVPDAVVPNFVADPGLLPARPDTDLLCIGTLEPRKNQQYALQVVAHAARAGHVLTLTIVGDGPDRVRLLALARELGIASQVRFAGGLAGAAALFVHHRACLHVARMESFGIVLIEAMAHGVPIFATAVGGVPEVFEDGREGRYLPLDDAPRAAALVSEWLQDPPRLRIAANAARERFKARFESGVAAERLLRFMDQRASALEG